MMEKYQPGDKITDRYQIIDLLDRGGTGIIYLAEDLSSKTKVAIKVVSLKQIDRWKTLELFEREAKTLAFLNHDAIPKYIDYFHLEDSNNLDFYLVQEWIVGKSLAALVENGWRIKEQRVKKIAVQILNILDYLHKLNPPVIHRDIKPQNIIIDEKLKVYLVDFGAVQNIYRNANSLGATCVGTYGYMPPEQFRGKAFFSSDLYSLGATILFLLTHRSPADLPHKRMKIDFRNRVSVSDEFANWLEKMLEPALEDRFNSAAAALNSLNYKSLNDRARSQPKSSVVIERNKPFNSKILLRRTEDTLKIKLPPSGLNLTNIGAVASSLLIIFLVLSLDLKLLTGTSTIYFTGLIGFTTFLAIHLAAIAAILFTLWQIFGYIIIKIEPEVFWITWKLFKLQNRRCGNTANLHQVERITQRNEQDKTINYCALWHGTKKYTFGRDLTSIEQSWLVNEILDFLSDIIDLMY